jgi:hypothetical protein
MITESPVLVHGRKAYRRNILLHHIFRRRTGVYVKVKYSTDSTVLQSRILKENIHTVGVAEIYSVRRVIESARTIRIFMLEINGMRSVDVSINRISFVTVISEDYTGRTWPTLFE